MTNPLINPVRSPQHRCGRPQERLTSNGVKGKERAARDRQVRWYDANPFLKLSTLFEKKLYQQLLGKHQNSSFLECGCGTGRLTHFVKNATSLFVGIDHSLESLKMAKKKHEEYFIQSDMEELPFLSERFDAAGCFQVLEHIPSPHREACIGEISRILKKGGRFVFSVYRHNPVYFFLKKQGFHAGGIYYDRFTEEEIKSLVSPAFSNPELTSDPFGYLWIGTGVK